jgi:UDP-N-acetylglucosamine diphosphorylase/glucosamine-1-phosphate N-acetyltransferase
MNPDVQIVILAGGKGTRMGETDTPKVLHPLHGEPLITHLLNNLKELSWDPKPVIVVGFKREQVMEALGDSYLYAVQEEQLGTGHAVLCAKPQITAQNILVLYGDMPFITAASLEKLVEKHQSSGGPVSMITTSVSDFSGAYASLEKYGRIIPDNENHIVAIREFKDATEQERKIEELNPGYYVLNTQWLWDHIGKITTQNAQNEYYITDIIAIAIASGLGIQSISVPPDELLGVNTKDELEIAHVVAKDLSIKSVRFLRRIVNTLFRFFRSKDRPVAPKPAVQVGSRKE